MLAVDFVAVNAVAKGDVDMGTISVDDVAVVGFFSGCCYREILCCLLPFVLKL